MNTPNMPDPNSVERILASMTRYPFATLLLIILLGLVAFCLVFAYMLKSPR